MLLGLFALVLGVIVMGTALSMFRVPDRRVDEHDVQRSTLWSALAFAVLIIGLLLFGIGLGRLP